MATQTITIDDIDGKSQATEHVQLVVQGVTYKLDLNDEHFGEIQKDLARWLAAAAVAQTRRASTPGGASVGAITLDGRNVTKAQTRTWLATKDEAWVKALPNELQTKVVVVDGKVQLTGPNYVPPAFMVMLRDEVLASRGAAAAPAETEPETEEEPEAPAPASKPTAPARAARKGASAKA